jgi:tRNA(Ile2) C34 agmatinyltransferase TiaS
MIIFGLDDTDNATSRGTGQLARRIAAQLADQCELLGVTRHQLLVDDRVPYTSHNSSAAITLAAAAGPNCVDLYAQVRKLMVEDFQPGSDPGLCMLLDEAPEEIMQFGKRAQTELVTQAEARRLASQYGILLEGLGGTEGGVIGALAAVGLASSGEDGRYLLTGRIREIGGLVTVDEALRSGIDQILTIDGNAIENGLILADKLRPARRNGRPVQFVEWLGEYWAPLKLN